MSHSYIHFGTIVARGSRTCGSNVAFGSLRPFGPGSNVARGSKRTRLRRFAFLVVCKFGLRKFGLCKFGFCVNLGRVNLGCLKSVQKCECKFGPV